MIMVIVMVMMMMMIVMMIMMVTMMVMMQRGMTWPGEVLKYVSCYEDIMSR